MSRYALFLLVTLCARPAFAAKQYSYFRVGSPNDITTPTTPGTVLMGGGTDVDAAFQWMCQRSGGGDFLVIRATGTDAYNPYIRSLCPGENSVATLIIPNTAAANDPFVAATINNAEALFIAGGDQADYISSWTGTPVENTLNSLIGRGVPVGGTSAGMEVLGEFIYSATATKSETSSMALADPFNKFITLVRDFSLIPVMTGLNGDMHFVTRDRMGRLIAFMARSYTNGWTLTPRAIASDEQTALLVDGSGNATAVGNSTVYFFSAPGGPEICQPNTPLTYQNLGVYRIAAGGTFNIPHWSGTGGVAYTVSANAGVLTSTQPSGALY